MSPFAQAPRAAPVPVQRQRKDPAPNSILSTAPNQGPPPKEEQEAPSGPGGLLGRGLGMILNNPVSRTVLRPLDVLDVPRRAVWSTINEAKDLITDNGDASFQDWYDQTNPLHVIRQKGDTSFGAGDVIPEVDTGLSAGWDKWINRGIGLAGDVALDPLTYVDGIGFVADMAKVARELDKLNTVQKIVKPLGQAEDAFRALGFAEDAIPSNLVGQAERAAALGGEAELERLGRRSLAGTNPVQREVMNIPEPGIRVKVPFTRGHGTVLPGTGAIGAAGAEVKAGVKEFARGLPGAAGIREWRAPLGVNRNSLGPSYERILTGQGGGSIRGAIDTIATDNAARKGAGVFGVVAADELERTAAKMNDEFTPEQQADLIRQAEENPEVTNEWTKFQDTIVDIGKYVGVDIPQMQGGRYVMPHILDRGFRNHVLKLAKANDSRAADFFEATGLTMDDLLEEGGFMQRRQWRPNRDTGEPFKAKIGGKDVQIEVGSIDELNTKLGEAFPEYKGRIYETDPAIAWRGYIESTKRDVAKRYAFTEAAKIGREGVEWKAPQPQQFDPYGGRLDLPPRKGPNGEDIPVQQVVKQEAPPLTPQQQRQYGSSSTTDSAIAATKARNKSILETQPVLLEEYRTASQARKYEIANDIEATTQELLGPISADRSRALSMRQNAENLRDEAEEGIELLGEQADDIASQLGTIESELKRISSARSGVSRTAEARTRRRQTELLDQLDDRRRELIGQRDELAETYRTRHGNVEGEAQKKLEEVRALAPERRRVAIVGEDKKMTDRITNTGRAWQAKKYELERKWKARGEFNRKRTNPNRFGPAHGIDPAGYASANRYIQEHADDLKRFNDFEEEVMRLRREVHGKYARDIDELTENIGWETKELNRHKSIGASDRGARQEYITDMINRRSALQKEQNKLIPQLNAAERRLNSKEMKVMAEALEYRTNHHRWLEQAEQGASQERAAFIAAQKDMEVWERAAGQEQAWTGIPPRNEIDEVVEAAAPSPEVVKAQKYLDTPTAQKYVADRTRLQRLNDEYIPKATKAGDEKIIKQLTDERDKLTTSLEKRAKIGERVEAAENTIKHANTPKKAPPALVGERPPAEPSVAPTRMPEPAVVKRTKQQTTDYNAGWRSGKGGSEDAWERAEARGVSDDWKKGYSDSVLEREKFDYYKREAEDQARKDARLATEDTPTQPLKLTKKQRSHYDAGYRSGKAGGSTVPDGSSADFRKGHLDATNDRPRYYAYQREADWARPKPKPEPLPREITEPTAPTVENITHPVLDELNTSERQLEQAALVDVGNTERARNEVTSEMIPQVHQTEMDLAGTSAQIKDIARGTDPAYNEIALDEGMQAIEKRRALSDEFERAKVQKGELTEEAKRLDAETGEYQTIYDDAMRDADKYRAQHRDIADKADANRVLRARDRAEMAPKKINLDKVAAGTIPANEAQPLQRTIDDLQKVIDANPNGDDALMARIEASLHPHEKALFDLTTELDLPARQVEEVITAARKGELAPVISYFMKSNFRTVWENGDVVINKELENAYKNLQKVLADPNQFSRVLTAYTNFFKTYATLTPGFHVRNGLSAIFMNTVDGVAMRNQLDGVRWWTKYAHAESPLAWLQAQDQDIQDAFAAVFASGAGGRYTEAGFARSASGGRRRQTAFNNMFTRFSQKVGQNWTEGPVRMGMALDSVRLGHGVDEAVGRITRIHFDYGQISAFDEKAKRLIPFWTFMSRNLPMQITEMWSKPRVYAWYNSLMRNVAGDQPEGTPDYFNQLGAVPFADVKIAGMPLFLQPDLGHVRVETDLSDIENLLSGENLTRPLTNLNPFFTALPEYMVKEDFYTGRQFKDTDLRKLGPVEKLSLPVLKALGLTKTSENGTELVEERLPNMLQALIPMYARSASLMPGVTTGAPDDLARQGEAWARQGLGLPFRVLSPTQQENTKRQERFNRIDDKRMRQAMEKAAR